MIICMHNYHCDFAPCTRCYDLDCCYHDHNVVNILISDGTDVNSKFLQ